MNTQEYATQLRAVAAFVAVFAPPVMPHIAGDGRVSFHLDGLPDWHKAAKDLQVALGGEWTANPISDFINIRGRDTNLGDVDLYVPRYQVPADSTQVDVTDLIGATS